MGIKFINVNCVEGKKTDLRQARAVLRHRPDVIVLEYPNNGKIPFRAEKAPKELFKEKNIKFMPWIKSDIVMWKNIRRLKKSGHEISVYTVDGPSDLVWQFFMVWRHMYPCALENWLWWVQIYLREQYMLRNIRWILKKHKSKKNLTVLVFLQSFHWEHIKFLLSNPGKRKIWKYYFGKFSEINPENIAEKIKKENEIFYKHWKK